MNWVSLLDEEAIAALLPVDNAQFAKPICEGLGVFLAGLPLARQTEILALQAQLPLTADVSERLGSLARSCPVLQKIGQVLARDQRLSPVLRQHLRQLESLPPRVAWKTIEGVLAAEFGDLSDLGVTLTPPAIAEASVAVVVPFLVTKGKSRQQGVFKILKPGIEEILDQELNLLKSVGEHLDERCDELSIPHLDYQEAFHQVRDKLSEETCLQHEQQRIEAARHFYADDPRVQIPALFDFCTPRVTAMERVWGHKVTEHGFTNSCDCDRLAELIVDAMIAKPIFATASRALFHSDPHAGNLMLTHDGRLAILDWSLVGWLGQAERIAIVQLMLSAIMHDEQRMVATVTEMSERRRPNEKMILSIVRRSLRELRGGQFPGLFWLIGLLDVMVRDARLRLKPDLMMFRKSLYTLEGVVADVGVGTGVFDQVVFRRFVQHFCAEWPSRWISLPNSREFATRLSNFDLAHAILTWPNSLARFWVRQGLDCWDNCQSIAKVTK